MFAEKIIPLDLWVSGFVDWLVTNYRAFFQTIKWPVEQTLTGFDAGLNWLHPLVVIVVLALAAWKFSGKGLAVFTVISLVLIGLLGLMFSAQFLSDFLPKGTLNTLFSAGIIPLIYIAVGFKVGAELGGVIDDLVKETG